MSTQKDLLKYKDADELLLDRISVLEKQLQNQIVITKQKRTIVINFQWQPIKKNIKWLTVKLLKLFIFILFGPLTIPYSLFLINKNKTERNIENAVGFTIMMWLALGMIFGGFCMIFNHPTGKFYMEYNNKVDKMYIVEEYAWALDKNRFSCEKKDTPEESITLCEQKVLELEKEAQVWREFK